MKASNVKMINLALQGGGAHGALTWGVLDYLLEDKRLGFEAISATSAGAMNAIVLAQGLINGDKEEARATLEDFWKTVSDIGQQFFHFKPLPEIFSILNGNKNKFSLSNSPFYQMFDFMKRIFSPYDFNPLNIHPLRDILLNKIDFESIKKISSPKLFISATNVETCRVRVFTEEELSVDSILASACLPFLYQAIEINGEGFWDGGYMGNPSIFPLIDHSESRDVFIIHVNPIVRPGVPKSAAQILNRLNEISFNSSLMGEMRTIAFVSKLIDQGTIPEGKMKKMLIHSLQTEEEMLKHCVSSKFNTDWKFLTHLKNQGRRLAKEWLEKNYENIGQQSSTNIRKEFL